MTGDELLARAVTLARQSIASGGGPFGAVVARTGRIVGEGWNRVVTMGDPTAHAEILALRAASRAQASHDLSGAVLYASCEPCPMCLAAAWWARVDRIVHAADRSDAAGAGFDDEELYRELRRAPADRVLPVEARPSAAARDVLREWARHPGRVSY